LTDRRASERIPIEVQVSLWSESQPFAGRSADLSTGGLFVRTDAVRPVGSHLLVAFSLPTGEIKTQGIVRWVRRATEETGPGLGIAFEKLLTFERDLIEVTRKAMRRLDRGLQSW
jgi:type IV pilus assembly protein PilZ